MYDETQEEKRWATYLFSKGPMIGLSEKLLHVCRIYQQTNERYTTIISVKNPLWRSLVEQQVNTKCFRNRD